MLDEQSLAEAIRSADSAAIVGGGTRGPACSGAPLSTAGITGVTLYEPAAMTLVARAGTPVAEIDALLAGENQRLAFEPPDLRALLGRQGQSTIGGVVSANASGPRRVQVGAARDALLGVRFIDGRGEVISNGGRVMKNVTGYDLTKLMAGSHGSLGVLTEVSLKVMPIPEAEATVLVTLTDPLPAMSAALATPYDISGASFHAGTMAIRIEGFAPSVTARAGALRDVLARFGPVEMSKFSAQYWKDVRDVTALAAYPVLARVGIKPSLYNALKAELDAKFTHETLIDWGGGLIWVGGDDPALIAALRGFCASHGGHTTWVKGGAGAPVFQPQSYDMLLTKLRAQFDPRGIFNQGI